MAYNNPGGTAPWTSPTAGATRRTKPARVIDWNNPNPGTTPIPSPVVTPRPRQAPATGGVVGNNPGFSPLPVEGIRGGGATDGFATKRTQTPYDGDARNYVNDALFPYWQIARDTMRANLADQGMLSSSAGLQRYSQDVEQPYAQAANTMYRDYINQRRNEDFARKMQQQQEDRLAQNQAWSQQFQTGQADVQNAQNLYNLLWSAYLNQWQLQGDNKGLRAPNDFKIFGDISALRYQQPTSVYSPQNIGDPVPDKNVEYVDRYTPETRKTLAREGQEANNAYQRAYLKLMQDEAARAAKAADAEGDVWSQMTDEATANRLAGLDDTPGDNYYPTQMLEMFKSKYKIDVEELVRQGDLRAEALVRSMYGDPAYADRVIARMKGEVGVKVPWRDFHAESGVPQVTGGRTPMPETKNYYSYPGAFPFPSK